MSKLTNKEIKKFNSRKRKAGKEEKKILWEIAIGRKNWKGEIIK